MGGAVYCLSPLSSHGSERERERKRERERETLKERDWKKERDWHTQKERQRDIDGV